MDYQDKLTQNFISIEVYTSRNQDNFKNKRGSSRSYRSHKGLFKKLIIPGKDIKISNLHSIRQEDYMKITLQRRI